VLRRYSVEMAEGKIATLRRHYEARARGDWDTVLALYSSDTVWDDRRLRPEGAIHRGRDAMVAEMRAWFGTWHDYGWTVEEMVEVGDQVLVVGRERGVGKGSGVEIDHRVGLVVTLRDGLIIETKVYGDPEEARASVAP
jgi:ketosteroid isomerase-like protein